MNYLYHFRGSSVILGSTGADTGLSAGIDPTDPDKTAPDRVRIWVSVFEMTKPEGPDH